MKHAWLPLALGLATVAAPANAMTMITSGGGSSASSSSSGTAVRPTHFLGTPSALGAEGIETSDVLPNGGMLVDLSSGPGFGLEMGLAPNLEAGANVNLQLTGLGTAGSGNAYGLGLYGKYRLLDQSNFGLGILAAAGFTSPNTSGVEVGVPISFFPSDSFSLHVMPVATSAGGATTFGGNVGLAFRLTPAWWVLAGDDVTVSPGVTNTVNAGLRYALWDLGTLDLNLVRYTTGGGFSVGTLGWTGYFGGWTGR